MRTSYFVNLYNHVQQHGITFVYDSMPQARMALIFFETGGAWKGTIQEYVWEPDYDD